MCHTVAPCVARNSQILMANMGMRLGSLTGLHPGGLRCHCCTFGKTKAMKRVHWERGYQDSKW